MTVCPRLPSWQAGTDHFAVYARCQEHQFDPDCQPRLSTAYSSKVAPTHGPYSGPCRAPHQNAIEKTRQKKTRLYLPMQCNATRRDRNPILSYPIQLVFQNLQLSFKQSYGSIPLLLAIPYSSLQVMSICHST